MGKIIKIRVNMKLIIDMLIVNGFSPDVKIVMGPLWS